MRKPGRFVWVIVTLFTACAAPALSQQQTAPAAESSTTYKATSPRKPAPEDTPAQRDALAKLKAKAEERTALERGAYNAMVAPAYDFHYGKKILLRRETFRFWEMDFCSRARFPPQSIAERATRKPTVNGARPFIRTRFERLSTGPASTF